MLAGQEFAANTTTFSVPVGALSTSLTGVSFDGFALDYARYTLFPSSGVAQLLLFAPPQPPQPLLGVPELTFIQTPLITMAPNISGVTAVTTGRVFVVNMIEWAQGNGHPDPTTFYTSVRGTVTETGLNLPEPSSLALLLIALAVTALWQLARSRCRWSLCHGA